MSFGKKTREAVYAKYDGHCAYCGRSIDIRDMQVDHFRPLNFAFYLHNVPYYVSTHLARHVHSVPFIKSQRNDRQSDYDRNAARQDAPVDMIWYMNAEELLTVANKRLCRKADPATQEIAKRMRTLVLDHCPEFRGLMAPPCAFMDECPEMEPCKEGQG